MSHHAPTSITDAAHGPATGDYECFCREVRRLYGIDLTQYRRGPMERRVRVLAARRGRHLDLVAYADLLAYDQAELTTFLSRVTVNVSRLWRNPGQWHLLEHDVIPGLAAAGDGRLRCWSAGSSYGAEAYTLAAVANRAVPHVRTTILGTDIDADMIARARAGVFSADDVRDAPVAALANYFTKAGGWWHVNDELRRRVRFEQGATDLAHGVIDVLLSEPSLSSQASKGFVQSVSEGFKHRDIQSLWAERRDASASAPR